MVGIVELLHKLILPLPPSKFLTAISVIHLIALSNGGLSEIRGKNMQYSRFISMKNWGNSQITSSKVIGSKVGMLCIYTPAALLGLASFLVFQDHGLRFLLLRLALTIHFFKRVLEVLFVHKYGSNGVAFDTAMAISLNYSIITTAMIYTQHLSIEFPEPSIDLKYVGIGLFLLGIGGNFYHHYILSKLREKGEKSYKIPKGGLFNQVICPHYLFEVLAFVGVSCISQTLYAVLITVGIALYLMGRSYTTKKWYLSKFEDFPKDVKAMIPFIF